MKSRVLQLRASPATFQGLIDADRELAAPREPDLILAYLPADGTAAVTLSAMSEVWPTSRRAGCEAAYQFAGGEIASAGCLQFFWLDDPAHRIRFEVVQGSLDEPPGASEIESACAALAACDAALLLADGVRFPVPALLAELQRHRAGLPPILAGALASLPVPYDAAGDGARVFLDDAVHPSACVFIGFEGFTMDVELVHEFRPASPIYTVTRADGQTVWEIGGESAVDWYRRFFLVDGQLAPMPRTAHSFPLMIDGSDPGRRHLCRALRAFDEPPGAVTCWGDVREGDQVRLGLGGEPELVATGARMARARRGDAAFLAAFAGRQTLLGEDAEAELAELHRALGEVPLAGLFTFGEIAPDAAGGLALQNQTALLALLAEKRS